MVIWSDDLDSIIPTCRDFEDRLIKLLWRSRPPMSQYSTSVPGSVSGHGSVRDFTGATGLLDGAHLATRLGGSNRDSRGSGTDTATGESAGAGAGDVEKGVGAGEMDEKKRGWFRRKGGRRKRAVAEDRPIRLFAPVYNGIAGALSFCASFRVVLDGMLEADGGGDSLHGLWCQHSPPGVGP